MVIKEFKPNWSNFKAFVLSITVVVISSLILRFYMCGEAAKAKIEESIKTEKIVIPGDKSPTVSKPYTPTLTEIILVPGPKEKIDTAAIIADYFAKRIYVDTLQNDSSMLVVVSDSVTNNAIVSRQFTLQNRRPIAVINNTTITQSAPKKLQLFAGFFGGYSVRNKRPMAGFDANVLLNESLAVGYGYDIANNGHIGHVQLKLTGRKKK